MGFPLQLGFPQRVLWLGSHENLCDFLLFLMTTPKHYNGAQHAQPPSDPLEKLSHYIITNPKSAWCSHNPINSQKNVPYNAYTLMFMPEKSRVPDRVSKMQHMHRPEATRVEFSM